MDRMVLYRHKIRYLYENIPSKIIEFFEVLGSGEEEGLKGVQSGLVTCEIL